MKIRVLILHTSVGYGIKMVAMNIFDKLAASSEYEPRIEDLQEVEKNWLTIFLEKVYLEIFDYVPFVWGFLYNSRLVLHLTVPLRLFVARFKSKRVLEILREFQPAIVICTQTTASGIIAYLKSKNLYRGKLVIVFSDYHLHEFWLYPQADLYLCNIAEQVEMLKALEIPAEKIALTGMLIADKYFRQIPKEQACLQFGLLTSMPTVLISSGSRGLANTQEVLLALLRSSKPSQIVVVTGKNSQLKKVLEQISAPSRHPVKILGFVDNQDVLMSAADVLIGKVGGPTIAEAVAKSLPIILTNPRPGHEEKNLEFLLNHKVVLFGRIPREVAFLCEEILNGKIKFNHAASSSQLLKPPGHVSLLAGVDTCIV